MIHMDPPDHTRLRSLVNKAFIPKAVSSMEDRIQHLVDGLLDTVQAQGRMEVISDLAYPLPVMVIAEMLGVPPEDRDRFGRAFASLLCYVSLPARALRFERLYNTHRRSIGPDRFGRRCVRRCFKSAASEGNGTAFRDVQTQIRKMIKSFSGTAPKIHETVFVADTATIIGEVEIGEDASVWFGSVIRGDVNHICIGARTNIQDMTMIHVSSKTHPTILEEEITVGHRVTLHGCHVERQCLIGIGSILLDGVRIGSQSLVAAGSLLTPGTQIPPRSLVMGAPAQVNRELTDDELAYLDRSWRNYVELKSKYL
jgi:carbonic anhydrase/acetyltransferase-like protein (isoleucine patch superfamily)